MKKTLVLTHEYYPFRGGVGRYCYNLFRRFQDAEYLVMTDQQAVDEASNIKHVVLISSLMRPSWIRGLFRVRKMLKREGLQMIFTPNILPLGTIAYFLNRFFDIPYVISLHGIDINLAIQNKPVLTKKILNAADHVIVNSAIVQGIVGTLGIATPVTVITPFLDESMLSIDPNIMQDLQKRFNKKKVILTVGRLVERKGQDMVLRAMPSILKDIPDAHYVMIGDGPHKKYLEELIVSEKLQDHAVILSNIPDDALGAYYTSASLFVMPTRAVGPDIEGFGITYLEAASFGLPIIAGRSGGEEDAVGHSSSSILLDGNDHHAIAHAVINVLEDEDLAHHLGENAKKHLELLPTWDTQATVLRRILT